MSKIKIPVIRLFKQITGSYRINPVLSFIIRPFWVIHPLFQKFFKFVDKWHLI
jgi:hypothetical protein